MILLFIVIVVFILTIIVYNIFNNEEETKEMAHKMLTWIVVLCLMLFLLVGLIAEAQLSNESQKKDTIKERSILIRKAEDLIVLKGRKGLSIHEQQLLDNTLKDIEQFNKKIERKQKQHKNLFLNWFVEPYVDEIELIEIKEYG